MSQLDWDFFFPPPPQEPLDQTAARMQTNVIHLHNDKYYDSQ